MTSKREEVLAYIREHPGCDIADLRRDLGIAWGTAQKYLEEAGSPQVTEVVEPAEEPAAAEPAAVVEADDEDVPVSRAYLLTLEALRDQVVETQRLRRLLENR
jgi:hypothetical protein